MKSKLLKSESFENDKEVAYSGMHIYFQSEDKKKSFRIHVKDETSKKTIERYEELRDYCLNEMNKFK